MQIEMKNKIEKNDENIRRTNLNIDYCRWRFNTRFRR